jgi:Arc/MetJ-type ribon-helix-helix transcriptional regulator
MVRMRKPELEQFIDEQVKSGRFESRDAAIEAAVERMMLEDAPLDDATLAAIDEAEEQFEAGQHRDWKEVSAELRAKYLDR